MTASVALGAVRRVRPVTKAVGNASRRRPKSAALRVPARIKRALMAAALCLAGAPSAALAHSGFNSPVYARLFAAVPGAPGPDTLSFELRNDAKTALTLIRLTAPGGERLRIERRREVFGLRFWQSVAYVRLDPGEAMTLGPPNYRLLASPGGFAEIAAAGGGLRAQFSPLGEVVALFERSSGLLELDAGPPDSAPPGEAAQTTE